MLTGYASTGQLRAAELCCAAQTLGLAGVDWLGYRDSGMAGDAGKCAPRQPGTGVAGEAGGPARRLDPPAQTPGDPLRQPVRRLRPPRPYQAAPGHDGGVPRCARWSRFPEAGPSHRPERLYHPAFTAGLLKVLVRLMPLLGRDPRRFGRITTSNCCR